MLSKKSENKLILPSLGYEKSLLNLVFLFESTQEGLAFQKKNHFVPTFEDYTLTTMPHDNWTLSIPWWTCNLHGRKSVITALDIEHSNQDELQLHT